MAPSDIVTLLIIGGSAAVTLAKAIVCADAIALGAYLITKALR